MLLAIYQISAPVTITWRGASWPKRGKKTPSSARVASPASLMTVLPSKPRGLSRKIKLILSLPHYVPEIYRNEALTADMAMEKIRLQFTSAF